MQSKSVSQLSFIALNFAGKDCKVFVGTSCTWSYSLNILHYFPSTGLYSLEVLENKLLILFNSTVLLQSRVLIWVSSISLGNYPRVPLVKGYTTINLNNINGWSSENIHNMSISDTVNICQLCYVFVLSDVLKIFACLIFYQFSSFYFF